MNMRAKFSPYEIASNTIVDEDGIRISKKFIEEIKQQYTFEEIIGFMCAERLLNYSNERKLDELKDLLENNDNYDENGNPIYKGKKEILEIINGEDNDRNV